MERRDGDGLGCGVMGKTGHSSVTFWKMGALSQWITALGRRVCRRGTAHLHQAKSFQAPFHLIFGGLWVPGECWRALGRDSCSPGGGNGQAALQAPLGLLSIM